MTPEMERAHVLRRRAEVAVDEASWLFDITITAESVLAMSPDLRELLVEMADACEAFVRTWEGGDPMTVYVPYDLDASDIVMQCGITEETGE
jgi:hypothetical protein